MNQNNSTEYKYETYGIWKSFKVTKKIEKKVDSSLRRENGSIWWNATRVTLIQNSKYFHWSTITKRQHFFKIKLKVI